MSVVFQLLWNYFTTSYGQFMDGQDTYDELELELKKEISEFCICFRFLVLHWH